MPSNHDPILLLEPSNLLEPLSLEDRELDPFNRAAVSDNQFKPVFNNRLLNGSHTPGGEYPCDEKSSFQPSEQLSF